MHFGADVHVDDGLVQGGEALEELLELQDADRRGFGQFAAGVHVAEDIGGRDLQAILVALIVEVDGQRQNLDLVALQLLGRQVGGTVGGDLDRHWRPHPFYYRVVSN